MERSSPLKMVDSLHVQSPTKVDLSLLGVREVSMASMGRWTGRCKSQKNIHPCSDPGMTLKANTWVPFLTLPKVDLRMIAQLSPLKENRSISTCCPIPFLLYFNQALLVAGGRNRNNERESSTELYLPSNNGWRTGASLPR